MSEDELRRAEEADVRVNLRPDGPKVLVLSCDGCYRKGWHDAIAAMLAMLLLGGLVFRVWRSAA